MKSSVVNFKHRDIAQLLSLKTTNPLETSLSVTGRANIQCPGTNPNFFLLKLIHHHCCSMHLFTVMSVISKDSFIQQYNQGPEFRDQALSVIYLTCDPRASLPSPLPLDFQLYSKGRLPNSGAVTRERFLWD
jgi:hypothetical protein